MTSWILTTKETLFDSTLEHVNRDREELWVQEITTYQLFEIIMNII